MRNGYLAIAFPDPADAPLAADIARVACRSLRMRTVFDVPRMTLLAQDDTPTVRLGCDGGIVIGELFEAGAAPQPVRTLDQAQARRAVANRGRSLLSDYWGEYVAVLADRGVRILRDPSGAVPCFSAEHAGIRIFFSHLDFPIALGLLKPEIDWQALAETVAYPALRSARTCLANVRELLPGSGAALTNGKWSDFACWTPWDYAAPHAQFRDRAEAIERLRDSVMAATKAWSSLSVTPWIELSGGIDSSIVASSLGAAAADFTCVTVTAPYPGADERRYAQMVADHVGAPLLTLTLHASDVDVLDASRTLRPRPFDHALKRMMDVALSRKASDLGNVDAFFSGSGGDYILGGLHTSAPAADALIASGFGPTFFQATRDVAGIYRETVWRTARLAIRKAWTRAPAGPLEPSAFLRREVINLIPEPHPWRTSPDGAWPGKAELIAMLAGGQALREGRDRESIGANRVPLLAQPVVECCLRTPSWMAVEGARNRAVARDAFSSLLPPSILERRWKGDFKALICEIVNRNLPVLKDLLVGGQLERNGILNKGALEAYLSEKRPPTDRAFTQLLHLAGVELWTAHWFSGVEERSLIDGQPAPAYQTSAMSSAHIAPS